MDWNGECDATNQIPPGLACPPGTNCVLSVSLSAVTKIDACAAVEVPSPTPEAASPQWQTMALVCGGSPPAHESECHDPEKTCAAASIPAAANFRRCIHKGGDNDCPAGPYTDKRIFYDRYTDARSCSACACSPPQKSGCVGKVTFYEDPFCSGVPVNGYPVDVDYKPWKPEDDIFCVDVGWPGHFYSKRLEYMNYLPGTCEPSGGEPQGAVIATDPTTICCLPDGFEAAAP
jgi:hypothetical protein